MFELRGFYSTLLVRIAPTTGFTESVIITMQANLRSTVDRDSRRRITRDAISRTNAVSIRISLARSLYSVRGDLLVPFSRSTPSVVARHKIGVVN